MIQRLSLFLVVVLFSLQAGCSKKSAETSADAAGKAQADNKIVVQLDWIPEPEHGGLYQAQAKGFFAAEGLDVVLLPGGTNVNPTQNCATGRANIAQADSTNTIVVINNQDLPIIQVAAVFQEDPSALMLHPDNPVNRFEDLNGKTLMARPQWAFLPYLKKKYGINFQLTPQSFSSATFVANKDTIQQGYPIAEPYHIMKAGGPMPKFLFAHDAGFDAYAVLIANRDWAAKHPNQLRAFLRAYIKGWNDYLEGDPAPAHEALKKANVNNTDDFMAFSRKMIIDERLVTGRSGASQTGRLSKERFAAQIKQLEDLGIIQPPGKLTVDRVMTTEYLP
ncbi:MAG TPA: ABC transporter substrate-binding protein [Opitutaceae bacterium]|nr:ABC transporter substrate-binding protein [Opitutaceae bacterium]